MNASVQPAIRVPPSSRPPARPPAAPADRWGTGRPWFRTWQGWLEGQLVAVLVAVAVAVRRPSELLARPLAVEEGWVAANLRTPLRLAAEATSAIPVGWTLLVGMVPSGGAPERLRLVPLALAAASVVPAYLLGRLALPRTPLLGGLVAGLAVGLAPAMLARQALGPETAEGFAAALLVLLATWLERRYSTRRLAVLAAAGVVCSLLAHTAVLITVVVVLALAFLAVCERDWRRLGELLAAGAAAVLVAVLAAWTGAGVAVAGDPQWAPAMVPTTDGPGYAVAVVVWRTLLELGRTGFGPWPLAAPAIGLGLLALWRARLRLAAAAVPAVWLGLLVAGLTRRYPFLDDLEPLRWSVRTSISLTVLLTMTAALGATWAVLALLRRSRVRGAVMVALTALGVFASAVGNAGLPPQ